MFKDFGIEESELNIIFDNLVDCFSDDLERAGCNLDNLRGWKRQILQRYIVEDFLIRAINHFYPRTIDRVGINIHIDDISKYDLARKEIRVVERYQEYLDDAIIEDLFDRWFWS